MAQSGTPRQLGTGQSVSQSTGQSTTQHVLDWAMMQAILSGLGAQMTDAQIDAYAENLLRPQLEAALQSSRQQYDAARLGGEQELENIAAALAQSIGAQNSAYQRSMADVETAALARGMGRSSYTLQTLANQGEALAQSVRALTAQSERQSAQVQKRLAQAAQQLAATQGRLRENYAASLAAKTQELRNQRTQQQNANYLTAISGAMSTNHQNTQTTTQQNWQNML